MLFSAWPNLSGEWAPLRDFGQHVEATGWDGLWVADHFMPNQEDNSGPTGEAWTNLANRLKDRGETEEAEEIYKRAIRIRPSLPQPRLGLFLLLESQQRVPEERTHLERWIPDTTDRE